MNGFCIYWKEKDQVKVKDREGDCLLVLSREKEDCFLLHFEDMMAGSRGKDNEQ